MDIVFLGYGNLGNPLEKFFTSFGSVEVLPLRTTSLEFFKKYVRNIKSRKIIFDIMDPNKIDDHTNSSLLVKAKEFRNIITESKFIKHYIYFSTASIYVPCKKQVFETSKTLSETNSKYLDLKKSTELFLGKLNLPLTICRIPNIWGHFASQSFFADLIEAYTKRKFIKYRDGDKTVISYININDLCILILAIIEKKLFGVINISTNSFNSRKNLKALINKEELSNIESNLGIRLSSKKLNWDNNLKKTDLPL